MVGGEITRPSAEAHAPLGFLPERVDDRMTQDRTPRLRGASHAPKGGTMSFQPGTLDGRVELRERLGQGGMGEVHAAWDRSLQRAVAVKFVHGTDPKDGERLLLEARLQARVDHPHVVR